MIETLHNQTTDLMKQNYLKYMKHELEQQGDASMVTLSTTNITATLDKMKLQANINLASILSNTHNPRIMQLQQPLYWLFIAIFMKIISPLRRSEMSKYPSRYKHRNAV